MMRAGTRPRRMHRYPAWVSRLSSGSRSGAPNSSSGPSLAPKRRTMGLVALAVAVVAIGALVLVTTRGTSTASSATAPTATSAQVFARSSEIATQRSGTTARRTRATTQTTARRSSRSAPTRLATVDVRTDIGFTSKRSLESHWQKHGSEFGNPTLDQYLLYAQRTRDAPLSDQIIQTTQNDGTLARFDRKLGAFLAYNRDLTIRTFFRPNDGEDYFWRASKNR